MPSFANEEENAPVFSHASATIPLYSARPASATNTPVTAAVKHKPAQGRNSPAVPFASVDCNSNGRFRYSPPPPDSPPPLPPSASVDESYQFCQPSASYGASRRTAAGADNIANIRSIRSVRSVPSIRSTRSSRSTASDMSAVSSSIEMGGRGGGGSSHATTLPPDDDQLDGYGSLEEQRSKGNDANGYNGGYDLHDLRDLRDLHDSTAAALAPSISPSRPPPPPPAPTYSAPPTPLSHQPPPAPPKPVSMSRKAPQQPTSAPPPPPPISVSHPLADRTRSSVISNAGTSSLLSLHEPPVQGGGSGFPTSAPSSQLAPPSSESAVFAAQRSSQYSGSGSVSAPATAVSPSVPPHRFSSPPIYNAASASNSALAGGGGGGPLKQRHTLEVPKASMTGSRSSREGGGGSGFESAFASGRFSPAGPGSHSGSIGGSISGRRASLSLVRRNTRSLHSDMPRDEVVPDEDALRWAEAYRQKRASKRRRMEQDDDQVLVGTKVDETHTNWVTAYNMLTGIRVSVSRTNAKLDRALTDEDFEAKQKSTFDIAGNELVPSAKYDFKFKDYAPWVFRHLRKLFHLDPADYLMSLAGKYILSELGSPGKSGSFFYFSRDYKYIIKTIHHSEHKFLRKILRDYYRHVMDNPNTLLSQFFGLHRVKMPYGRKVHFVVMNNLFPPHRDIHQTYDLKGSTIGRDYPEERLSENPRATLKDLNWMRRQEHVELGIVKKRLFLEQLQRDVRLLQRLEIMDYSLLVGIHDLHRGNDENLRGQTLQVFEPGKKSEQLQQGNSGGGPSGSGGPGGGASSAVDGDAMSLGAGVIDPSDPQFVLMRTPSKLEHQRKTRELRQMLKSERPIPIGQSGNKMPDELDESKKSIFYQDDGGFRATHQNNTPGEEIYYLGVIDCLTHYGIVKKIEHFWKGLSHDRNQISALPPQQYGERFLQFMSGITMSPEDARSAQEQQPAEADAAATAGTMSLSPDGIPEEGPYDIATTTTGRDKGKEADLTGSWSSSMRRRGVGAGPSSASQTYLGQNLNLSSGYLPRTSTSSQPRTSDVGAPEMSEYNAVDTGASTSTTLGMGIGGGDRREPMQQPALPMVEEAAGEASSTGEHSGHSASAGSGRGDDFRPLTPAKDDVPFGNQHHQQRLPIRGNGAAITSVSMTSVTTSIKTTFTAQSSQPPLAPLAPPPPPPITGSSSNNGGSCLKPESADSGYGVSGGGGSGSGGGTRSRSGTVGSADSAVADSNDIKTKLRLSRESLDKALPPLPRLGSSA